MIKKGKIKTNGIYTNLYYKKPKANSSNQSSGVKRYILTFVRHSIKLHCFKQDFQRH